MKPCGWLRGPGREPLACGAGGATRSGRGIADTAGSGSWEAVTSASGRASIQGEGEGRARPPAEVRPRLEPGGGGPRPSSLSPRMLTPVWGLPLPRDPCPPGPSEVSSLHLCLSQLCSIRCHWNVLVALHNLLPVCPGPTRPLNSREMTPRCSHSRACLFHNSPPAPSRCPSQGPPFLTLPRRAGCPLLTHVQLVPPPATQTLRQ